jgi:hypothetical protein
MMSEGNCKLLSLKGIYGTVWSEYCKVLQICIIMGISNVI